MYEFTPDMDEISGFGGSYEQACRDMLKAALDWKDQHPKKHPKFKGFKNVFGVCISNNRAAKQLEKVILEASNNDCTGAMFQAVVQHYDWIQQNGWDKYREVKRKQLEGL